VSGIRSTHDGLDVQGRVVVSNIVPSKAAETFTASGTLIEPEHGAGVGDYRSPGWRLTGDDRDFEFNPGDIDPRELERLTQAQVTLEVALDVKAVLRDKLSNHPTSALRLDYTARSITPHETSASRVLLTGTLIDGPLFTAFPTAGRPGPTRAASTRGLLLDDWSIKPLSIPSDPSAPNVSFHDTFRPGVHVTVTCEPQDDGSLKVIGGRSSMLNAGKTSKPSKPTSMVEGRIKVNTDPKADLPTFYIEAEGGRQVAIDAYASNSGQVILAADLRARVYGQARVKEVEGTPSGWIQLLVLDRVEPFTDEGKPLERIDAVVVRDKRDWVMVEADLTRTPLNIKRMDRAARRLLPKVAGPKTMLYIDRTTKPVSLYRIKHEGDGLRTTLTGTLVQGPKGKDAWFLESAGQRLPLTFSTASETVMSQLATFNGKQVAAEGDLYAPKAKTLTFGVVQLASP
ncbi:MAG: hypothetical protein AAFX99_15175, partial [Myxococcota bacterium]